MASRAAIVKTHHVVQKNNLKYVSASPRNRLSYLHIKRTSFVFLPFLFCIPHIGMQKRQGMQTNIHGLQPSKKRNADIKKMQIRALVKSILQLRFVHSAMNSIATLLFCMRKRNMWRHQSLLRKLCHHCHYVTNIKVIFDTQTLPRNNQNEN